MTNFVTPHPLPLQINDILFKSNRIPNLLINFKIPYPLPCGHQKCMIRNIKTYFNKATTENNKN